MKIIWRITCLVILLCACIPRAPVSNTSQTVFEGVKYIRERRNSPRPLVIHVVKVDLRLRSIQVLVTAGDPDNELPLKALTTSRFARQYGVQVAINGDGFQPWRANSFLDYYPHNGDRVAPIGFAASRGIAYTAETDIEPILYISRTNQAQFNNKIGNLYNAISGNIMIVRSGQVEPDLTDNLDPRSAVGLSKSGKEMILMVVDGRQKGYSEGVSLNELARLMIEMGAFHAMNLDGGGSSTLVMMKPGGNPEVLNSPIHNDIPGRERPVGNHIGILAEPVSEKQKKDG
jgi:hypothetical protein